MPGRLPLARRQPAQVALIMPIAVITCIGILGLVLDLGVFRMIDSEFKNAADAAALAAAWYDPVCPVVDRRLDTPPGPPVDARCVRPDNQNANGAVSVANSVALSNLGLVSKLCADPPNVTPQFHPIQSPNVQAVSVIITCNAPYLAGAVLRISPGSTSITRWATAGLGSVQLDGTYVYAPGQDGQLFPLKTSLVPL
jgi:hypothetical protein